MSVATKYFNYLTGGGGGGGFAWILFTGSWNDDGGWIDSSSWID